MATILRESYVFGPVKSRRLGVSLGINVLPIEKKICSFNCIYCECGWNNKEINENIPHELLSFPKREVIKLELELALTKLNANDEMLDVITFSGNGEPTLHPNFSEIINDTIELRNKFMLNTQISVLSNSTNLGKDSVVRALKKIDKPILKLDSANINTFEKMNMYGINNNGNSGKKITIDGIIEGMKKFDGNFTFQTMFLSGEVNGDSIDNTTDLEVKLLMDAMKETNPNQVMIYPIDRETPAKNLIKLDSTEMKKIATMIESNGFNVLYV